MEEVPGALSPAQQGAHSPAPDSAPGQNPDQLLKSVPIRAAPNRGQLTIRSLTTDVSAGKQDQDSVDANTRKVKSQ